jgi:heme/copper-type cytochrome/quinol oxidase subunit 2
MSGKVKLRSLLCAACAAFYFVSQGVSALAQCAMCKASVQASADASANPQAVADAFNLAVLVLLIPPVLIFAAFFLVLLRYRRGGGEQALNRFGDVKGV